MMGRGSRWCRTRSSEQSRPLARCRSHKVAVNEPGDSAKARSERRGYTDHSDSSSTRTVISVMVHFVQLRRHRRANFPLLDVRSSVCAAAHWAIGQGRHCDRPQAGRLTGPMFIAAQPAERMQLVSLEQ